MTEITKIAVCFHSDTCNGSSAHSFRTPALTNVKMAIQKVGKDPEQNLVGCFAEFQISSESLHCVKWENMLLV